MPALSDAAIWIAAIAAGVAALGYLAKKTRDAARAGVRMLRAVIAIQRLVERELEHNHGSSMKDDIHGMAVAIGQLQRDRDDDREVLDNALELAAKHHPDDAWLYIRRKRR